MLSSTRLWSQRNKTLRNVRKISFPLYSHPYRDQSHVWPSILSSCPSIRQHYFSESQGFSVSFLWLVLSFFGESYWINAKRGSPKILIILQKQKGLFEAISPCWMVTNLESGSVNDFRSSLESHVITSGRKAHKSLCDFLSSQPWLSFVVGCRNNIT